MIDIFSPKFATSVWARQSAELTADIPFTEAQVRVALLAYTQRPEELKALNRHSEAVSAINGMRTPQARPEFLVQEHDTSLSDYAARVDALVGSDEWSVAYFGLFAASTTMWDTAKGFADGLALTLGHRPGGRVDIDCFVGRYSSTHTGVHVDYAHNFAFTLRDGKTMFTWPGDRSDLQGLKSPDYDEHKASGTALANNSDRVAYFPQEYMHVAESKDDVSINVNVAFWDAGNDSKTNADYLRSFLRTPSRTRHDVRSSGAVALGADDDFLLSTTRSLLDDGTLRRRMAIAQLISDTSSRLGVGRPLIDVAEVEERVTLTGISTLQWIPMHGLDEVLVAANGHVAAFPYSRDVDDFLTRLADGETIDIARLQGRSKAESDNELLRVIMSLARWGAL
ncbi:hypothetical protein ACX80E_03345 [Arthrobacter sp. TMN-49]